MRLREFCCGSLLLLSGYVGADSQAKITINYQNAPIEQVLSELATAGETNIVIAPEVKGEISLQLTEVPWFKALELVVDMAQLQLTQRDNWLKISPPVTQVSSLARLTVIDDRPSLAPELIRSVFQLVHGQAAQLASQLQQLSPPLMTASGHLTVVAETNSLVLWDSAAALPAIKQWLKLRDQPVPQIEISAQIISIDEQQLQELGVVWHVMSQGTTPKPRLARPLQVERSSLVSALGIPRLGGELLQLELRALEQEDKVEIIASPRLITANNATASIKQGTEIAYLVTKRRNDMPTVEFREAVLGMQVTPELMGQRRVRLKIHLSQNVPHQSLQRSQLDAPPSISKQEIETEVIAQDGETLALGGIFQQHRTSGTEKVPLLGNIPLIGQLFRRDNHQQKRRELVIFITPRLRLSEPEGHAKMKSVLAVDLTQ